MEKAIPHIYKERGMWYCRSSRTGLDIFSITLGFGTTQLAAYQDWKYLMGLITIKVQSRIVRVAADGLDN